MRTGYDRTFTVDRPGHIPPVHDIHGTLAVAITPRLAQTASPTRLLAEATLTAGTTAAQEYS
jgi:hypothetical protein